LGSRLGTEEAGDLLGEGGELRVGLHKNVVIVAETLTPNSLDDWEKVLSRKLIGRPAPNDRKYLFGLAVVFIRRRTIRDEGFGVGIANEFAN